VSERDGFQAGVPCWVAAVLPASEAGVAFYTELFGWRADPMDIGGFTAAMWRLPGFEGGEPGQPVPSDVVGVMLLLPGDQGPDGPPPHWGVDFWVTDAATTRATDLGLAPLAAAPLALGGLHLPLPLPGPLPLGDLLLLIVLDPAHRSLLLVTPGVRFLFAHPPPPCRHHNPVTGSRSPRTVWLSAWSGTGGRCPGRWPERSSTVYSDHHAAAPRGCR
jgi:hypothetical protein